MLKEHPKSSSKFPFFSIANPGVLRRSFDIPEPIIHPPGTEPYLVLNPNLHTENGLESLPALDMDPGSVSQTEFFSRTTELTVSEHAGGTLSEPAMESTTSYSPANSGVVAQKIVNDVTVTHTRSKDTQSILCDICNVACNSEDVLEEHKQGKRHQKNVQKLAVSSAIVQEMLPPAKDATLHHEPQQNKKQDLMQSEVSVDSLFVCGIRDVVGSINQNIFTEHIEVETLANRTSVVQPSTDKSQHKPIVHKTQWCELCNVSCGSDKTFQRHILGKKHKKIFQSSEKIPSSNPPVSLKSSEGNSVDSEHMKDPERSERIPDLSSIFPIGSLAVGRNVEMTNSEKNKSTRCDLCGICCNTYDELNKHILGKKHKKKLKLSEQVGSMEDDERCKRKANWGSDEEDGDRKKQKTMMMEEVKASISCKVCNVVCNSLMAFTSHLAGPNHSAMVLKQVKVEAESNGVRL